MNKKVQIQINSSQHYGDYADQINTSTMGEWRHEADGHTLDYVEKLDGDLLVANTLVLRQHEAELVRSGGVSSRMVFAKGKTTDMVYQTEYGQMNFKIATQRYEVTVEENRLHVLVQYDLKQHDQRVSANLLQIDIMVKEERK